MKNTKCPECQFDEPEKYGHGQVCSKYENRPFMDNNKEEVESFPGINSTSYSSMNPEFYAPQSPVSEEEDELGHKINKEKELIFDDRCSECKKDSHPSEENWKLTANYWIGQFNGSQTDAVIAENLKSFIRSQRLEAQRELAEEMEKHMRLFSDSSHSNTVRFLFSKGLLPKITEDEV